MPSQTDGSCHGQETTNLFPLSNRIHTCRPRREMENGDPLLPEGAATPICGVAKTCPTPKRQGAKRATAGFDQSRAGRSSGNGGKPYYHLHPHPEGPIIGRASATSLF